MLVERVGVFCQHECALAADILQAAENCQKLLWRQNIFSNHLLGNDGKCSGDGLPTRLE
mgnify:FL=1